MQEQPVVQEETGAQKFVRISKSVWRWTKPALYVAAGVLAGNFVRQTRNANRQVKNLTERMTALEIHSGMPREEETVDNRPSLPN